MQDKKKKNIKVRDLKPKKDAKGGVGGNPPVGHGPVGHGPVGHPPVGHGPVGH